MNALVEKNASALAVADTRTAVAEALQHAATVQQVLTEVMKKGIHFDTIPGTDKPSLLQPGADVLAMVFRIGHELDSEDLSTGDVIRYRVKCRGRHQVTGAILGEGVGECSGGEDKYRWRRAVCDEEFEATPLTHRRMKYGAKKNGGHYTVKQVRTEPADAANTVLKMAVKRAKIAMVLNVTGASAVFGQDVEDLSDEMREAFAGTKPPAPAELTDEQRAEWKAAAEKGRKSARAFWQALPDNVRSRVAEAEKVAMWAIAEKVDADATATKAGGAGQPAAQASAAPAADSAQPADGAQAPSPAPAPVDDDDFVAAMDAAERAAGSRNA